jgi:hypothetical protein
MWFIAGVCIGVAAPARTQKQAGALNPALPLSAQSGLKTCRRLNPR